MEWVILFFARWLTWVMLVGAGGWLLWEYRHHPKNFFRELVTVIMTVWFAWIVSSFLKLIISAPRPFVVQGIDAHFFVTNFSSFPSGHATLFFGLATALYFYNKQIGIIFFIGAIFIAVSRVLIGVHYSQDIMVGAIIGVIVAVICQLYLFPKKPVK